MGLVKEEFLPLAARFPTTAARRRSSKLEWFPFNICSSSGGAGVAVNSANKVTYSGYDFPKIIL